MREPELSLAIKGGSNVSSWKLKSMVLLNEQRNTVFLDRYAKKDEHGQPVEKSPEEMWSRVSSAIGNNADENIDFYNILRDFKFVPGGRILAGAGTGTEQTFYNCYVIPVEPKPSTLSANPNVGKDSREAIFDTIGTMVDIMSRGGGVGVNWSTLRPSGAYLSRVSGTSSGPVGWMDVASKAVGEVIQGGSRRGAAMFMLNDWHPDILNFIEAKRDLKKITNANVSVAISDKFMKAVKDNAGWQLEFPNTTEPRYNAEWDGDLEGWKRKGFGTSIIRSLPARQIWDAIIQAAWDNGEPGVVFLDRYNEQSTGRDIERIICVNPCGEQGLGAYSVCNLGSMNLAAYIFDSGERFGHRFDFEGFKRDVGTAVRFLDNVIDKSFYWDERSRAQQKKLRRIGLGVMGLADALIMLGLRYGSDEAVKFTENVFRTMKDEAIFASAELALDKGPAEGYDDKVWTRPYLTEFTRRNPPKGFPFPKLRNLFFLTQAPTGTTSILAGVNSGIEPYFASRYTRRDRTGVHEVWAAPWEAFVEATDAEGVLLPKEYVTANDVTVEEHIAMQAAVQKYVDSSVSKTINAPNSHKIEDVDKAYRLAYDKGLKGLAYFRDGSGRDQVLTTEKAPTNWEALYHTAQETFEKDIEVLHDRIAQLEEESFVGIPSGSSEWQRPAHLTGSTSRLNTSMGTLYLTLNRDDAGNVREVFVNVGKAGSDVMAMGEAIGRLVSLALQSGITLDRVSEQLVGVGGTSIFNPGLVHAIGKALADEASAPKPDLQADPKASDTSGTIQLDPDLKIGIMLGKPTNKTSGTACPDCGNFSVVREEGCQKCHSCGWSAC